MDNSPDLNEGMLRLWIEPKEKEALQTRYGNYALSVLTELRDKQPNFPEDILVVGDNWFQLSVSRDNPSSDIDREAAKKGFVMFGDMWPIMDRDEKVTIKELLGSIESGVRARSLDDRIMDKIAVLDLTSVAFPIISDRDIANSVVMNWGKIIKIRGSRTEIYHITGGFARKTAQDLVGTKPSDDISAAVIWNKK